MACAVGNCLSPLGSLKRPAFCGGPELVVVLSLSLRRPDIISTASDRSGFPQFRQADGFDHYFSWLEDYFRIINERELACPSRYGRPHRRAVPRSPHLEKMPRRGRGIIEQARRKPPGSPRCGTNCCCRLRGREQRNAWRKPPGSPRCVQLLLQAAGTRAAQRVAARCDAGRRGAVRAAGQSRARRTPASTPVRSYGRSARADFQTRPATATLRRSAARPSRSVSVRPATCSEGQPWPRYWPPGELPSGAPEGDRCGGRGDRCAG